MFDPKIDSGKDGRKSIILYICTKDTINNSLQISHSWFIILEVIQVNNIRLGWTTQS